MKIELELLFKTDEDLVNALDIKRFNKSKSTGKGPSILIDPIMGRKGKLCFDKNEEVYFSDMIVIRENISKDEHVGYAWVSEKIIIHTPSLETMVNAFVNKPLSFCIHSKTEDSDMKIRTIIEFKTKEQLLKVLNLKEYQLEETKQMYVVVRPGEEIKLNEKGDIYIAQSFYTKKLKVSSNYLYQYYAECVINTPCKEKLIEAATYNDINIILSNEVMRIQTCLTLTEDQLNMLFSKDGIEQDQVDGKTIRVYLQTSNIINLTEDGEVAIESPVLIRYDESTNTYDTTAMFNTISLSRLENFIKQENIQIVMYSK